MTNEIWLDGSLRLERCIAKFLGLPGNLLYEKKRKRRGIIFAAKEKENRNRWLYRCHNEEEVREKPYASAKVGKRDEIESLS